MEQNSRNFAIFIDQTDILWHFGNLDLAFMEKTANFLRGLNKIGRELSLGEGIATIKLKPESRGGNQPEEILVISQADRFFFIVSDPLTTMRLIEFSALPEEAISTMRGMLAGQAAQLFANLSSQLNIGEIEELFKKALQETGIKGDLSSYISQQRVSVGALSLRELVLFHYFFREKAEKLVSRKLIQPWAIATTRYGVPIHMVYRLAELDQQPILTAGYLAVIVEFASELFESHPYAIIFSQESQITSMELVMGEQHLLCLVSWAYVLADVDFLTQWQSLAPNIINDLQNSFSEFVSLKLADKFQTALSMYPLTDILYILGNFSKIEKSLPLLLIEKEKFREMFEHEENHQPSTEPHPPSS